jgi:hypothetical protein
MQTHARLDTQRQRGEQLSFTARAFEVDRFEHSE